MHQSSRFISLKPYQRPLQLLLGLFISGGLLWWSGRDIDFAQVRLHLSTARYSWIVPLLVVRFFTFSARSWRWSYLLKATKRVPFLHLFAPIAIGYMANNLFPFRLGEVVRTYALKKQEEIPLTVGLTTVALERIFDGVTLVFFIVLALFFVPLPTQFRPFVILGAVVFLGGLGFLIALTHNSHWVLTWMQKLIPTRWHAFVIGFVSRLQEGLNSLRSRKQLLVIAGTSILVWFLETGKFWFMTQVFSIEVPYIYLILTMGIVNLVSALPATPGFVGTFDAPIIIMFGLYGIDGNISAAYTLILHVLLWSTSIILGSFFALRLGLKWTELKPSAPKQTPIISKKA